MANFARGLIGGYALGTDIGERLGERRREKQFEAAIAPYTPEEVYGQVTYAPIEGAGQGLQVPEARYVSEAYSPEAWEAYVQESRAKGYEPTYTEQRGWRVPFDTTGQMFETQEDAYRRFEKERLTAMMPTLDRENQERVRRELRDIQQYEDQQARLERAAAIDEEKLALVRAEGERAQARLDMDALKFEMEQDAYTRSELERAAEDKIKEVSAMFAAGDTEGGLKLIDAEFPGHLSWTVDDAGNYEVFNDGVPFMFGNRPIGGSASDVARDAITLLRTRDAYDAVVQGQEDKLAQNIEAEIEANENFIKYNLDYLAQLRQIKADTSDPDELAAINKRIEDVNTNIVAAQQAIQVHRPIQTPQYNEYMDALAVYGAIDEETPQEDVAELFEEWRGSTNPRLNSLGEMLAKKYGLEPPAPDADPDADKERPAGTSRAGYWARGLQADAFAADIADQFLGRSITRGVPGGLTSGGRNPWTYLFGTPEEEAQQMQSREIAKWYKETAAPLFRDNPALMEEADADPVKFYEKYKSGVPGMKRGGLVRKYKDGGKVEEKPKKEKTTTDRYKIYEKIDKYASEYGVDPAFMRAVVRAESNFDPKATSPVGAMGLGQLMPGTAKDMGVKDPYDVDQNLRGTAKYLSWLQGRHGSLDEVLAAYNYGTGNVDKHGVDWIKQNIPETRDYITKVRNYYGQPQVDFGGQTVAPRGGMPPYVRGEGAPDRAPLTYEDFETRRRPGLRRPVQMPQAGPVAARPQMYSFDNPNTPPGFYPMVNMSEGGSTTGLMDKIRNWRKGRDAKLKEDAPGALGRAGLSRGDMAEFGERLTESLAASPRPYEADMPYQPIGDSLEMLMQRRVQAPDLSQYYAYGGQVRDYRKGGDVNGPGTSTSDSIPAMLSDGEYVINAKAVKMIGEDVLDKINALGLRKRGR